jgi:hypothetical protein
MSLLSSRQFVVTASSGLHFYDIPELLPVQDGLIVEPVLAEPTCVHALVSGAHPSFVTPLGFDGPLALLTSVNVHLFHYSRCPRHPNDGSILETHSISSTSPSFEVSNAVFSPGRAILQCDDIYRTCTIRFQHDERGYIRLGEGSRIGTPFAMRTIPMQLVAPKPSDVVDVSWDEESGQLCLLKIGSAKHEAQIVIVHF